MMNTENRVKMVNITKRKHPELLKTVSDEFMNYFH